MNSIRDGMNLVLRTINPIRDGVNLGWRTMNSIRGHFLLRPPRAAALSQFAGVPVSAKTGSPDGITRRHAGRLQTIPHFPRASRIFSSRFLISASKPTSFGS